MHRVDMRSRSRRRYTIGFLERILARVAVTVLLQRRYTVGDNVRECADEPDERYKGEQCFRCPERARISWGRAMRRRVRGTDLSLSRSGQRHIDAPWPCKFNQEPYVPDARA
jgi:hypothetical protein